MLKVELEGGLGVYRSIFRGASWGAGALILGAAAWAIAHNAGYAPLVKASLFLPVQAGIKSRPSGASGKVNMFLAWSTLCCVGLGSEFGAGQIRFSCGIHIDIFVRDW